MAKHLDSLARELSCSICLSVMSAPVARLPCCHYFCLGCIQQSVKHKAQCPVCKAKVGRRELRGDGTMDRVVQAFAELEACKEELLAGCSASPGTAGREPAADGDVSAGSPVAHVGAGRRRQQQSRAPTLFETAVESLGGGRAAAAPGRAPESGREEGARPSPDASVRAPAAGGICWLAGVDNEEYRSPSVSYANSSQRGHQPGRQAQQQQQEGACDGPDARRLSLLSVQAAPIAGALPAGAAGKVNAGGQPEKPPQGGEQQPKGGRAQRGPAQLDGGRDEAVMAAPEEGEVGGGVGQDLAASGGPGEAEPPSPGLSSDIQGLAREVAAAATAVAAGAPSGSCHTGSGAAHLTPPQPAQAAAPTTHKVPVGEVGVGAAQQAQQAQRDRSATAARKRASNAAAAEAAPGAGDRSVAAGTASGSNKRRKRASAGSAAAGRASGAAAAAARRRSAPAAAAAAAMDAATPGPLLAAGAAGAASAGGEGGSRRRIPARLLPWNCAHCTFENQGAAHKCDMCGLKKKVLPGAELATLAGGTPATAVAAAAQRLQRPGSSSPAPEAVVGGGSKGPAKGGSRQRKMSSGGPGGSGKRRKMAAARAPSAPSSAEPSLKDVAAEAAAAPPRAAGAGEGWRDRGESGSWVLLGSLLAPAARGQLQALAQASGASLASEWSPAVTHVVCGTADGAARRTYKYLRGVLAAQAVVTDAWLPACLAAGRPVDEAAYLVAKERGGEGGGAAAARASAALGLPPLLHGFEVFLAGKFCKPGEVAELLAAAGAKRLTRPPTAAANAAANAPCTAFLLCDTGDAAGSPAQPQQQQENEQNAQGGAAVGGGGGGEPRTRAVPQAVAAAKWYQRASEAGVPVVSHRWLLDSISSYTVKPLPPYRVGGGALA